MARTALLNVVGLTGGLLGAHTPALSALAARGRVRRLRPVLPAVTCSVQASMLTGVLPREHGIVGNGWFDRALGEVHFWKQSNRLVEAEKAWETARRRRPGVTCANMFWWFNMGSSADWSVTPRPIYKADGRKIPDCYSQPAELRDELHAKLGRFPLFQFWGPGSSIESSRWIARAALHVHHAHPPDLLLVYLPHLDYGLQKLGPEHPAIGDELRAIDGVAGELIEALERDGVRVIVVSEYGIEPVDEAVPINRILREQGGAAVRIEQDRELLDPFASAAFAVADHQVAHVYVRDAGDVPRWAERCRAIDGVEQVLDRAGQAGHGLDHARSGDLVLVAAPRRWFSYGWWLDERRAPDYARTVDIHRKPGYDPLELFIDPRIAAPRLRIAWTLAKRRLGVRSLLDVIPLDTSLVRGSHGRLSLAPEYQPVMITPDGVGDALPEEVPCTAVRDVVVESVV